MNTSDIEQQAQYIGQTPGTIVPRECIQCAVQCVPCNGCRECFWLGDCEAICDDCMGGLPFKQHEVR